MKTSHLSRQLLAFVLSMFLVTTHAQSPLGQGLATSMEAFGMSLVSVAIQEGVSLSITAIQTSTSLASAAVGQFTGPTAGIFSAIAAAPAALPAGYTLANLNALPNMVLTGLNISSNPSSNFVGNVTFTALAAGTTGNPLVGGLMNSASNLFRLLTAPLSPATGGLVKMNSASNFFQFIPATQTTATSMTVPITGTGEYLLAVKSRDAPVASLYDQPVDVAAETPTTIAYPYSTSIYVLSPSAATLTTSYFPTNPTNVALPTGLSPTGLFFQTLGAKAGTIAQVTYSYSQAALQAAGVPNPSALVIASMDPATATWVVPVMGMVQNTVSQTLSQTLSQTFQSLNTFGIFVANNSLNGTSPNNTVTNSSTTASNLNVTTSPSISTSGSTTGIGSSETTGATTASSTTGNHVPATTGAPQTTTVLDSSSGSPVPTIVALVLVLLVFFKPF